MSQAVTDLPAVEPSSFIDELRQGTPGMFRVVLTLTLLGFMGLALVDPYVATGADLELALVSRVIFCLFILGVLVATFIGDWVIRHGRVASIITAIVTGHEVVLLTYLTGGGESSYHEALHIVMFGYALPPFPWKRWDAPLIFGSYVLGYNLLLIYGDRTGSLEQILSHNALLMVTVMVASVFQRVFRRQRFKDFLSREALAAANVRLQALDDAKSRFFSNLSHELRTPLTLILAPVESLLENARDPVTEGQAERLRLAHRNALRLLRLVDDLLSLTKAEATALKPQFATVDLAQVLEELYGEVEVLAARKDIAMRLDLPARSLYIDADRKLLDRVLLNLISNAAKFVKAGGSITIGAARKDDGIEVIIADTGVGIAKEHLSKIFDRFFQADSGSTRAAGGTGIGLSLVRELVELHGGHVAVDSEVGVGTTMRCWFPAATTSPPSRPTPRPSPDGPGSVTMSELVLSDRMGLPEWHEAIRSARAYRYLDVDDATERRVAPRPQTRGDAPTVLVVEDNPDMIRFLVALMAYEYNVFAARNGVDALRLVKDHRPDLIISDVMMPEMDGFELVRQIRATPETRDIPFIFLTARGGSDDRVIGHAGGADTYLAKPFRSEELLAAAESLLTRQATVRAAATSLQEEALVYMAGGVADSLSAALSELDAVAPGLAAETASPVRAQLGALAAGLRGLVTAGARPPTQAADIVVEVGCAIHTSPERRRIQLVGDGDTPLLVCFEPGELGPVLAYLLRRACEVSPSGAFVAVSISASDHHALVAIRDEGPPMPKDQTERLFFPFGTDVDTGAEGLVLATARRLLAARGGEISVSPVGEMGTEITLHLPRVTSPPEAADVR